MTQQRVSVWRLTLICSLLVGNLAVVLADFTSVNAAVGDRQRIAYLDRNNNVWIARTDGSEARSLTQIGGFQDVHWSPDGTRILATGPHHEGGRGIFLMSPDPGFELRSLNHGRFPAWSPDGARFAFIDDNQVHVFNRNGDYERSVEIRADVVRWAPDGRSIGYTRVVADPYNTGCAVRELGWINVANGETHVAGPSVGHFDWAADADRLLYVSATSGTVRAYSISNRSSTLLTSTLASPCSSPVMKNPDGRTLVFFRVSGEIRDLVTVDLDNRQERIFQNVPVGFPAFELPEAYVQFDPKGQYVYLARSYPTDVHRLDLRTGSITPLHTGDWRRVVDIAPDGQFQALLNLPTGRPAQITIRDEHGVRSVLDGVGWMAWQPWPLNLSAVNAWQTTWERQDRPVASGQANRTWIWGPEPFDAKLEHYDEAPDNIRATRYYDKSRMEITRPHGSRNDAWYVTNGLLVREMITGQMQVGDARFIERSPADVPVAGDPDDPHGPTYATLAAVIAGPAQPQGEEIRATINRAGEISNDGPEGVFAEHFVPETGQRVASVFWEYLDSKGPVWVDGRLVEGQLFEPRFFATGLPITGAYWSTVRVGGQDRQVLIQCFERRCLTYTPDNPEDWRVEMGNVGRHYHAWRYSEGQ